MKIFAEKVQNKEILYKVGKTQDTAIFVTEEEIWDMLYDETEDSYYESGAYKELHENYMEKTTEYRMNKMLETWEQEKRFYVTEVAK